MMTRPRPRQFGQTDTSFLLSAPKPLQVEHVSYLLICNSFSTPNAASSKVIVILVLKSAPRLLRLVDLVLPPPNIEDNISSKPPKPPKLNPSNAEPKPEPKLAPWCPNWSYCSRLTGSLNTS